jgi:hypothetical protein
LVVAIVSNNTSGFVASATHLVLESARTVGKAQSSPSIPVDIGLSAQFDIPSTLAIAARLSPQSMFEVLECTVAPNDSDTRKRKAQILQILDSTHSTFERIYLQT